MYIARKIQENVSTGRVIVALEQVTSPTNTSKISQDHGNSRWRSSLPRTLSLADSPTSICRLPSVVFPVISLLTDKPKCSSEVSSVASNWWSNASKFTRVKIYHGPSKRKSKRFFLYRELFDIARDIISFFFTLSPPPLFFHQQSSVPLVSKHLLNGKRSFRTGERKTIYRRSSLEMFNCHCGSFKCGAANRTRNTRPNAINAVFG